MYSEKLAVAIKHGGKVLREFKDTVYIPFGSEYTILIKNLNSVRCLVKIDIDGTSTSDGTSFIVPARGEIELERFFKNGNLNSGNRFKFIERNARVEEHRGIGVEDGLIRVEFEFEREPEPIKTLTNGWPTTWPSRDTIWCSSPTKLGQGHDQLLRGYATNMVGSLNASYSATASASSEPAQMINCASINDVGITVPGSVSEQKFTQGTWFPTDGVKHVMVVKLLGEVGQQPVTKPVTVKTKQKCTTCGHQNKANAKFCSECGTGLQLV